MTEENLQVNTVFTAANDCCLSTVRCSSSLQPIGSCNKFSVVLLSFELLLGFIPQTFEAFCSSDPRRS